MCLASLLSLTQSAQIRPTWCGRARPPRHGRPAQLGRRAPLAVPRQRGRHHVRDRGQHAPFVELSPESAASRATAQVPKGEVSCVALAPNH